MEKRISYDIFMSVKRVYQACAPLMNKRASVKAKLDKLMADYKSYDDQISSLEAGIKAITGFRVEELVHKVMEDTGKVDPKTGKPVKTPKYLPTSIVTYDKANRQFVVTTPDPEEVYRIPQESNYVNVITPKETAGSDFDLDKEIVQQEAQPEPEYLNPVDMDIFQ